VNWYAFRPEYWRHTGFEVVCFAAAVIIFLFGSAVRYILEGD
jgi:hypothetical protein